MNHVSISAGLDLTERQLWAAATYSRLRMLPPPPYLRQLYNEQLLLQARQSSRHALGTECIEKPQLISTSKRKRKNSTPMKTGIKRPWEDANSDGRPSSPLNDEPSG